MCDEKEEINPLTGKGDGFKLGKFVAWNYYSGEADVLDDLNMPAGSIWPANTAWASPSPVCH